jgi:tetratricopeptide (TPR) repeat protein
LLKLGERDPTRDPGKFALAAGAFEEADRIRPNGPAKPCLGYALQQGRHLDEARLCYEEAERAGRGSAALLNNLGIIYLSFGKYDDAERCFNHALTREPGLQAAYHNRGRLFLQQAKPSAAKVTPIAVRKLAPAAPEQDFLKLALRDLSQAIELGPPSDELYRDAATVLVRLSKYDPELRDRAIGCLDLALQYGLEPNQLDRDHFKSNLSGHWWFDDLRKRPHVPNTAAPTQCLVAIPAD